MAAILKFYFDQPDYNLKMVVDFKLEKSGKTEPSTILVCSGPVSQLSIYIH